MSILALENVRYTYRSQYQTVEALKGVSCAFDQGKIYAVVGKSGSGKSTMLSLMAGLDVPESGDVLFRGKSTVKLDLDAYRRNDVSMIYQSFRLFPLLTAAENVMYPMELHGMKPRAARDKAEALLAQVSLPAMVANRFPSMLSGGEQQRVAIARALAMETKLMLADEPTGNLDNATGGSIMEILRTLAHEKEYCVVVVTHDLSVLESMDVTYRMQDGLLHEEIRA